MNGKEGVWEQVEAFRRRYLVGPLAHLPVDVFTLAELELKLDIIPFPDLNEKFEVQAALMHDFSGIYVDADSYVVWEKGPRAQQRRLRFSIAHELGHYVLHHEIAKSLQFRSFDDFARWVKGNHGRQYDLEQAANEFAGRLLVPVERLQSEYDRFATGMTALLANWYTSASIRHQFADTVKTVFEVNTPVIES